jgi:hypothetical protein
LVFGDLGDGCDVMDLVDVGGHAAARAADRLASLQALFDKANLLVVTLSPPTLGAQHIDLHSPVTLKLDLRSKSSGRLSN